jgi:cytoskeletal protein CcmA (bactofilin family)
MKRSDVLRKLEERLARGEISEKTYLEIKARYDAEPEEPVEETPAEPPWEAIGAHIEAAVAHAAEGATQAAAHAAKAAEDAIRAVEFSGVGTKLSDEAIKIVGSGVVSGNPVRTVEFKSAGSAKVQGPLMAEVARIAGSCSCDSDVTVEEFRAAGSTRIAGSLKAENIEASGSLHVGGQVEAEEISASGSFHVDGSVTAEQFHSSGAIRIGGDLHAEEVRIDLGGTSTIGGNLKGEDIAVKATGGFFRVRGDLTVNEIEGEDITLEATNAKLVRGEDVRIGPHCRIDVVEAKELVVHQSSEVGERRTPQA